MRPDARRLIIIAVSALLVPIVPFVVIGELPGERWLMAADGRALAFGATGAALLAADLLVPVPSSVVGTLLGARLGLGAGFAWAFAGLMAAALLGYAAGRLVPARFAARLPGRTTAMLVLVARPVPVLAEATALTAGAGRIPLWSFVASAAVGNAVYAGALALAGARLIPHGWAGPGVALAAAIPVLAYFAWRLVARRS